MIAVFDLDGTLLDSDDALVAAFVALGVPRDAVTFGHVLVDECDRLGIDLDAYLQAYDVAAAQPFPGVEELVGGLSRWAVCSNKNGPVGRRELDRLGWSPEVALFADHFGGAKVLGPVLECLGAAPADVIFVGDTEHDRACAVAAGVPFALAAWNPRAVPAAGDLVVRSPGELLSWLERRTR